MALGLHEAAHDPEGPYGFPVFGQKPGDDGVVGFLPGGQAVVHSRIQAEVVPPVVEGDAGAGDHDAGAKAPEIALDEGDHVPFSIGGAQVHGAPLKGLPHRGSRACSPIRVRRWSA